MPRSARVDVGGVLYHVINRANGLMQIFNDDDDYRLFEQLLIDTKKLLGMRFLAYVLMPNHWHLVLYPKRDGDLGVFMHRLSNAHTRKVHAKTKTNGSGHLYQGRYKSFLVDKEKYLLTLIKYVERNPVRAKLTRSCENWQWGSAWRRIHGNHIQKQLLDPSPTPFPYGYAEWINTPDKEEDLRELRNAVNRCVPYGRERWVDRMVEKYHLASTIRAPGRPKKK